MNGRRRCCILRQSQAYRDHGELRAARRLNHVKIAVAVSRIERFDGYRDQKLALSRMTDTFAARRVAHTIDLMQRVRDMIGESGLFQDPLTVRSEKCGRGEEQEGRQNFLIHNTAQNLMDTDRIASP